MPITVREVIQDMIEGSEDIEIDVDSLEENTDGVDRIDIVKALQSMEEDGLGVFMKGRRGKKSRFVKGAERTKNILDKTALNNLRESISSLDEGDVMLASLVDCKNKEELTKEQEEELKEYEDKPYAAQFFNDNTVNAVEALKVLQKEGLGCFMIGRRGKFSRFIKGISKEDLQNRPKGISIIEKKDPKYTVVNNIILRTYDEGEYDNISDVAVASGVDNVDDVRKSIIELGYYII